MTKIIDLGEVTLSSVKLRSILIYPGEGGTVIMDYIYDRIDANGGVYDTLHHEVSAPAALVKLFSDGRGVVEGVENL